jgi:hypothetical protein
VDDLREYLTWQCVSAPSFHPTTLVSDSSDGEEAVPQWDGIAIQFDLVYYSLKTQGSFPAFLLHYQFAGTRPEFIIYNCHFLATFRSLPY